LVVVVVAFGGGGALVVGGKLVSEIKIENDWLGVSSYFLLAARK